MASTTVYHTLGMPEESISQPSKPSSSSSNERRFSNVCMTRSGILFAAFLLGAMVTGIQIRHKPEDHEGEATGMTGGMWLCVRASLCACVCGVLPVMCAWVPV